MSFGKEKKKKEEDKKRAMVTSTYLFEHSSEGTFFQVVVFDTLGKLLPNLYLVFPLFFQLYMKNTGESNILVRVAI